LDEQPSLGELIRAVRRELEYAHDADAGQPLRFDVGTVELDVEVELSKTWQSDGGFDVKVVKAGLSRESLHGSTSKMHVVLTPRDLRTSDGRYDVSATDTEPAPPRPQAPSGVPAGTEPSVPPMP
jgi:Trypsin-co-occurring domain 2